MSVVAIVRAIVGAVVGGFLVVYGLVAEDIASRPVIVAVGLFLMGAISVDTLYASRRDG